MSVIESVIFYSEQNSPRNVFSENEGLPREYLKEELTTFRCLAPPTFECVPNGLLRCNQTTFNSTIFLFTLGF